MPSFVRIAALSVGLYALATAAPASAFTITFDEAGSCTGCTGFAYTTDPSGTFSGKVLIYDLPSAVTFGQANIQDSNGTISDTLYFFPNQQGLSTEMIFYSYDTNGLLADVGTTDLFPTAPIGATEDASGHFTYVAGANTYNGVSGVSAVPLPAALPLFATGLAGLGLLGWRRKKKAAAV